MFFFVVILILFYFIYFFSDFYKCLLGFFIFLNSLFISSELVNKQFSFISVLVFS